MSKDTTPKTKPVGWLARYKKDTRPLLEAFLMGTHERAGLDSLIRCLPQEILGLIFSHFLVSNFCFECGEEATYACANRPGARAT